MTRECTTERIKRTDLLGLLDTMSSLDNQRITARMPVVRIEDLHAAPEPVELAEGTPQTVIDARGEMTKPATLNVRFRKPHEKMRAIRIPAPPAPVAAPSSSDMTLIGVICTFSLSLCAALAWLA
jgi:hypothetical protein